MNAIKMHANTLSRPECFITELARVGVTINMSLYMLFDVAGPGGAVVTSLAALQRSLKLTECLLRYPEK